MREKIPPLRKNTQILCDFDSSAIRRRDWLFRATLRQIFDKARSVEATKQQRRSPKLSHSPALFNIFIKDLSSDLREGGDANIEDLLFYADDILILCTSPNQVEKWCTQNGLKLNKDKSGIVVFADRRAQKIPKMELKNLQGNTKKEKALSDWTVSQKSIQGIPLCKSYKYLGTFLTSKLSCGSQIGYIKKETAHLFIKLYTYLANASAETRRDLWQTIVTPLYNAAFALLYFEPSQTHKRKS